MAGIKVFSGIGIGKAFNVKLMDIDRMISLKPIQQVEVSTEMDKVKAVIDEIASELEQLQIQTAENVGEEESLIFEAHLMMLLDPTLQDGISEQIQKHYKNAAHGVLDARNQIVELFMAIEDEYLRGRAADVKDVTDRLLYKLLGLEPQNLSTIHEATIIFAKDLKPSETVNLNQFVQGIVLEEGSITSHAAIVAKAKGIPTIVGLEKACELAQNGDKIILDTDKLLILVNPESTDLDKYAISLAKQTSEKERLKTLFGKPAVTTDGKGIKLYGNIGSVAENQYVKEQGGEGIGLLRTELIYMDSDHFPTEEEQFKYYKQIVADSPDTIIRTLDIGGDKMLPYYTFKSEMNPFLGERAIRFCLNNESLFIDQIKAILRASAFGKTRIMFPMISNIEEIRRAKMLVDKAKQALRSDKLAFDESIEIGIMIEIPSAAISADLFATEVDFFSIGTNDLCQYVSAVDRMNTSIAHLYQPYHPSILRLIQMTVDAGKANGVEVGVCGEMAGDPILALLLLGMGVDELSMSASMIPIVKDNIMKHSNENIQDILGQIKLMKTASEIEAFVNRRLKYAH